MFEEKKIILKKGKDASLLRKHHWVFSGAIAKGFGSFQNGDIVSVYNEKNNFIAKGYYNSGSIAVKILSFDDTEINQDFFNELFQRAYDYRNKLGLINNSSTNCFRLIHAEGDGIPGLMIDYYNGHIVVQSHHEFINEHLDLIKNSLLQLFPNVVTIYVKNTFKTNQENYFLHGNSEKTIVTENNIQFEVDWVKGQKTGLFLDQRINRNLLGEYARNKKVLNTFCYTGGFSLYAMMNNAIQVDSVDYSKWAIEQLENNIQLNKCKVPVNNVCDDALDYLSKMGGEYDVIILDPPAFAKSISAKHNAIMAYKRINQLAIKKIQKGGILFTYSCSQVVDKYTFNQTVLSAAIEAKRNVKILHQLHQPPDHPINIFHPETEYLKGLVLYVE